MCAIAMALSATAAFATPAAHSQAHGLKAKGQVTVTATQCDNRGSSVTIEGSLEFTGIATKLTFRNNVKGTHELVDVGSATMTITPGGGSLSVPKQPSRGGVGGNPWISFQFTDAQDNALGDAIVLGRCVQGLRMDYFTDSLAIPANAAAFVQAVTCSNKASSISVNSQEDTAGVNGWLLMDNNINKVVHRAEAASAMGFVFADAMSTHKKGWGAGGAGGNPLVYLDILDSAGASVFGGGEKALGRCNKLY
jgi:hypothetical protein